jgi:PilZ domain
MDLKRKAKRVRFDHPYSANLLGVDGTWRRNCVLIDVSDTGAKLRIDGSTDVLKSKEFFLLLSATGLAFRRCELVWVNGLDVGVQFVTERSAKARRQQSKEPTGSDV